ncbi:TadE/TadG family type IV pilus assembly protein [Selenomonas sp. KH1T6]|uniref:TadE/TadG family type IV pilus assembly protein n=1 Tax=Selenomonas sp. KH1T6 TaxID=3158784 RepID=UPI0008A77553|nr:Putative Flp pilus-assembly TadE/G-like [Selenomonas ruminantium]
MRRLGNSSQKGAVLVFVALLLPMLVFFGGMAIDFGRAYLYKSDLQNAADAAALAGVAAVASTNGKARLINDANVPANAEISSDTALKNKAASAANAILVKDIGRNGANDANTKLRTESQEAEDGEHQKNTYYYMVELTDEVRMVFARLFLPDSLLPDGWNIKVVARAWAKAGDGGNNGGNDGVDLLTQMNEVVGLELPSTFNEWWKKEVGGNTMETAQQLSYTNTGVQIGADGSRSEIFNMDGTEEDKNVRKNLFINFKQDIHYDTTLVENFDVTDLQGMSYEEARSLFYNDGKKFVNIILPNGKVLKGPVTWDTLIRELGPQITYSNDKTWWNLTNGYLTWDAIDPEQREIVWKALTSSVTATINVTEPFPMRDVAALPDKDVSLNTEGERNLQDPLYVMIESEEFNETGVNNTIHDININITADNTGMTDGKYDFRPIVFAYEGPVDVEGKRGEGRKSNTVVVNLGADFRGIIFAPNSSVRINVTGEDREYRKFQGIIIAKSLVDGAGNEITMPADEVTTDNAAEFQDFYRNTLNLKGAVYDDFGVVKLNVYKPEKDIFYLTSRASITI